MITIDSAAAAQRPDLLAELPVSLRDQAAHLRVVAALRSSADAVAHAETAAATYRRATTPDGVRVARAALLAAGAELAEAESELGSVAAWATSTPELAAELPAISEGQTVARTVAEAVRSLAIGAAVTAAVATEPAGPARVRRRWFSRSRGVAAVRP